MTPASLALPHVTVRVQAILNIAVGFAWATHNNAYYARIVHNQDATVVLFVPSPDTKVWGDYMDMTTVAHMGYNRIN
tara:strand:+ start:159 stop:389 length:231 start_codon:yes stop_codon:yes gene_type:complete